MKEIIQLSKSLFNGWFILLTILLYTVGLAGFTFFISKNPIFAIILGLIGGVVLFYSINVINETINNRTKQLNEINKYVTYTVFYLKIGKNVYDAFNETVINMPDAKIKVKIEEAMDSLITTGRLELDQFKEYNFQALDVFHSNLIIKSVQGGKAKEIFRTTTSDMNQELNFRMQLLYNKQYILQQEWFMLGTVYLVPALIAFTGGSIYVDFVNMGLPSLAIMTVFMLASYLIVYLMKKNFTDLSVSDI